uniref:RRM domain-containing protein n=1 Tax=Chrysotila carterae TaxID=13221 RepID=A0A7S4EUU4_CHRCT
MSWRDQRNNAKNMRNFDEADRIRDELRAKGVSVDDRARTWSTSDGRSGALVSGGGFARGDKVLSDGSFSWENTIFIQGLPVDARAEDIADFFGSIGPIKKSKKSYNMGEPTVHIYKDKRTGQSKGEATVSYEDTETAKSAIDWFHGNEFAKRKGTKLSVSIARRPASGSWDSGKGGKGKGKGGGGY